MLRRMQALLLHYQIATCCLVTSNDSSASSNCGENSSMLRRSAAHLALNAKVQGPVMLTISLACNEVLYKSTMRPSEPRLRVEARGAPFTNIHETRHTALSYSQALPHNDHALTAVQRPVCGTLTPHALHSLRARTSSVISY